MKKPLVLCILDGVGFSDEIHGNAVKKANLPTLDFLLNKYPHSLLKASGESVGLLDGQCGNSEVGHMNIGAGRAVLQPPVIINEAIKNGSFFTNKNILEVINHTKKNNSKLHVMGLLSEGKVHSLMNHLMKIIDMCKENDVKQIYFHIFTDGRDTYIHSAYQYVKELEEKIKALNLGRIVSMTGRYYAMDRDNNWDRIKLAYDAIVNGEGARYDNPKEMIEESYERGITDEFIKPAIFGEGRLEDKDGIIVFNYRPDRLRELFTAITNSDFNEFDTKKFHDVKLVTMFPVADTVICTNAFNHQLSNNTFGEYISKKGLHQLRIAETEKYAHVTYFFDGGVERQLDNATRILIKSPAVATYDLQPSMSAEKVTDVLLEELDKCKYDVVILNYANGDMVGHTGNYQATVEALEFIDHCLKRLYDKVMEKQGLLMITADHGNSDYMLDKNDKKVTSHSNSLVPFIITKEGVKVKDGRLADVAPTMLYLLNLPVPDEITGKVLVKD